MISDTFENLTRYRGLGANLDEAIQWLVETDLTSLEPGTTQIRDDAIRAIVQEYETVPEAGRQYEAHRRFVDIQCVVAGSERMLVVPLDVLTPAGEYDANEDIVFFDAPAPHGAAVEACRAELIVPAGGFAVFFPQDAHMPMLQADETAAVKKVVVKVATGD